MAEKVTLTVPLVSSHTISDYEVLGVSVGRDPWRVVIRYRDTLGNEFGHEMIGVDAEPLVKALNTANLSIKSLERRALEKLITDGLIPAGTVTGIPD
jgi:hypothetical protein